MGVLTVVQWVKNPAAVAGVAIEARVRSLAWEFPYTMGVIEKEKKKKRKRERKEERKEKTPEQSVFDLKTGDKH